jgi:hypothetical protein
MSQGEVKRSYSLRSRHVGHCREEAPWPVGQQPRGLSGKRIRIKVVTSPMISGFATLPLHLKRIICTGLSWSDARVFEVLSKAFTRSLSQHSLRGSTATEGLETVSRLAKSGTLFMVRRVSWTAPVLMTDVTAKTRQVVRALSSLTCLEHIDTLRCCDFSKSDWTNLLFSWPRLQSLSCNVHGRGLRGQKRALSVVTGLALAAPSHLSSVSFSASDDLLEIMADRSPSLLGWPDLFAGQIKELSLSWITVDMLPVLGRVLLRMPHLTTLKLFGTFATASPVEEWIARTFGSRCTPLEHLRSLELMFERTIHINGFGPRVKWVDGNVLQHVARCCPNLERARFGGFLVSNDVLLMLVRTNWSRCLADCRGLEMTDHVPCSRLIEYQVLNEGQCMWPIAALFAANLRDSVWKLFKSPSYDASCLVDWVVRSPRDQWKDRLLCIERILRWRTLTLPCSIDGVTRFCKWLSMLRYQEKSGMFAGRLCLRIAIDSNTATDATTARRPCAMDIADDTPRDHEQDLEDRIVLFWWLLLQQDCVSDLEIQLVDPKHLRLLNNTIIRRLISRLLTEEISSIAIARTKTQQINISGDIGTCSLRNIRRLAGMLSRAVDDRFSKTTYGDRVGKSNFILVSDSKAALLAGEDDDDADIVQFETKQRDRQASQSCLRRLESIFGGRRLNDSSDQQLPWCGAGPNLWSEWIIRGNLSGINADTLRELTSLNLEGLTLDHTYGVGGILSKINVTSLYQWCRTAPYCRLRVSGIAVNVSSRELQLLQAYDGDKCPNVLCKPEPPEVMPWLRALSDSNVWQ